MFFGIDPYRRFERFGGESFECIFNKIAHFFASSLFLIQIHKRDNGLNIPVGSKLKRSFVRRFCFPVLPPSHKQKSPLKILGPVIWMNAPNFIKQLFCPVELVPLQIIPRQLNSYERIKRIKRERPPDMCLVGFNVALCQRINPCAVK